MLASGSRWKSHGAPASSPGSFDGAVHGRCVNGFAVTGCAEAADIEA